MISRLRLRNVQSHASLTVPLDQPITTIVGASDLGKSAILRALKWVCLNKPRGEGLLRVDTKQTKVEAVVDGRILLRERGEQNLYRLDGVEYRAFGNDVPEDIAKMLGVGDLNFQDQHDAPFWFSLSPGQVAKELNRVVDLDLIDEAMSKLSSGVRAAKQECEVAKTVKEQAAEAVAETTGIEAVSEEFSTVERLYDEWQNLAVETVEVERLLEVATNAKTVGVRAGQALVEARSVIELGDRVWSIGDSVVHLTGLIADAENSQQLIFNGDPTSVDRAFAKYTRLKDSITILSQLVGDAIDAYEQNLHCEAAVLELKEELHKETEGRCPICGNEMKQ